MIDLNEQFKNCLGSTIRQPASTAAAASTDLFRPRLHANPGIDWLESHRRLATRISRDFRHRSSTGSTALAQTSAAHPMVPSPRAKKWRPQRQLPNASASRLDLLIWAHCLRPSMVLVGHMRLHRSKNDRASIIRCRSLRHCRSRPRPLLLLCFLSKPLSRRLPLLLLLAFSLSFLLRRGFFFTVIVRRMRSNGWRRRSDNTGRVNRTRSSQAVYTIPESPDGISCTAGCTERPGGRIGTALTTGACSDTVMFLPWKHCIWRPKTQENPATNEETAETNSCYKKTKNIKKRTKKTLRSYRSYNLSYKSYNIS